MTMYNSAIKTMSIDEVISNINYDITYVKGRTDERSRQAAIDKLNRMDDRVSVYTERIEELKPFIDAKDYRKAKDSVYKIEARLSELAEGIREW